MRSKLIKAFNTVLNVPEESLQIISQIVGMLHTASLLYVNGTQHQINRRKLILLEWMMLKIILYYAADFQWRTVFSEQPRPSTQAIISILRLWRRFLSLSAMKR